MNGGTNLEVVNATTVNMKVRVPVGASHPSSPVDEMAPAGEKATIKSRKQDGDRVRAYQYEVSTEDGKKAIGHSDPILIIEN